MTKAKPIAKKAEYEPTPYEKEVISKFKKARAARSQPSIKLTMEDGEEAIEFTHPDVGVGTLLMMESIGTMDDDFVSPFISQLVNMASRGKEVDVGSSNFALAVVRGIQPRDHVESMLAAQMAAVHMASMTFARRLAHVENIQQQDSAERALNKLTRTFAAQMSALKEYRSKGEQKVTVQHVHVAEGGQAIVGNVNSPSQGGGATEKTGGQPHAVGYAPGVAMPCEIEAERNAVPVTRRSGE